MTLKTILLQNFRSYIKSEFSFGKNSTLVVGPNTSGKTNLVEAVYILSTGKSFRAEKDDDVIRMGENLARIRGTVDGFDLQVVLGKEGAFGHGRTDKKYLVNGVSKKRLDFAGNLKTVLFSPMDLDIVISGPSKRRDFLNNALTQVDRDYRLAIGVYEKGLRQRNALLQKTKETQTRNEREFAYWDNLLIENGSIVTKKREELIAFMNSSSKNIFDFVMYFDKSVISKERLLQYRDAEVSAGVTLVGPHRDDFSVSMFDDKNHSTHDMRSFGSRGQQRLVVLQLKMLELLFIEKNLGFRPLLLLDDIFSELDKEHIDLVTEMVNSQQTIITTTHEEFIPKRALKEVRMIKLKCSE